MELGQRDDIDIPGIECQQRGTKYNTNKFSGCHVHIAETNQAEAKKIFGLTYFVLPSLFIKL